MCEQVCAWFPAIDWCEFQGEFYHLALSIARIGSRSFFFVDNLYKLAYCHLSIRKQWECKLLNSTLVMEEQCLNAEMHIRMITTGRQYLSTFSMECPVHHGQPECTILLGVNMVKPYGAWFIIYSHDYCLGTHHLLITITLCMFPSSGTE